MRKTSWILGRRRLLDAARNAGVPVLPCSLPVTSLFGECAKKPPTPMRRKLKSAARETLDGRAELGVTSSFSLPKRWQTRKKGNAMSSTYARPGSTTSSGSPTVGPVKDLTSTAQDTFNETVEQVQNFAQVQYDQLEASIRRNPLQAAAIAAGVGFVLALLARR